MTSHDLYTIDMSPDDFVGIKDIDSKIMAIDNLIEAGYDFFPEIAHWFKEVLLKVKETGLYDSEPESPGAELLLRLVQPVGKDVHKKSVQDILSKLWLDSKEGEALSYVIEKILVAAIDDEFEEVRMWATDLLQKKGRMKNSAESQDYLINIIKGAFPYYLKGEAIHALADRGNDEAITTLTSFAKKLLRTAEKGLYERTISNLLKEKVAYGLGLTGNQGTIKILTVLHIFTDDPSIKDVAMKSLEKIKSSAAIDDYEIAVGFDGERDKLDRKVIPDETNIYQFEIVSLPSGRTKISLFSAFELVLSNSLKLNILTGKKRSPLIGCTLKRKEERLEVSGYVEETLNIEEIQGIRVVRNEDL